MYAEKICPGRVQAEGRIRKRRSHHDFTSRHDEPYKDKHRYWKQAWPRYLERIGQPLRAITCKPVEESEEETWEHATAKRMQDVAKDVNVLTPSRKMLREELEVISKTYSKKAPPMENPPTMRVEVGGRSTRNRDSTAAKKATAHGLKCCKSTGGARTCGKLRRLHRCSEKMKHQP